LLQTAGWQVAAPEARRALEDAAARLAKAGIVLADRNSDPAIEEVEGAISGAMELTRTINAWEGRWPLNTYRNCDKPKSGSWAPGALYLGDGGSTFACRLRPDEVGVADRVLIARLLDEVAEQQQVIAGQGTVTSKETAPSRTDELREHGI
jgi:hypothetical protein